ncbi:MAG TPA: Ig-like domain-containing protein, partial [Acidobacteriaceae bacterium]|nr:Ig-like domain-containing protein [Acidobacteriaceae bacterium]
INSLPGGSYQIVASYGGSATVAQSASTPVAVTVTPETSSTLVRVVSVNPATLQSSASAVVPYGYFSTIEALPYGNRSPVEDGQPVPDGLATGTVTFREGVQALGTEPVGLNGFALAEGYSLSPGNYTILAAYSGDNSFDASTGSYALLVSKGATTATVAASQTSYNDQPIDFTVSIGTESSGVAPTGTVELVDGSTVLATAELTGTAGSSDTLAAASATISTSNLPPGTNNLQVVYLGDGNYAGSTSNSVAITGKPAFSLGDITINLVGERATSAAYLPLISTGSYAGTVNLSCALVSATEARNPPQCAMYPASVTLSANQTTRTEILIFGQGTKLPPGTTPGDARPARKGSPGPLRPSVALVVLLSLGIPARRRRWRGLLPALLLLGVFTAMTACQPSGKKISAGQYQFTVTGVDAQDATIRATATVNVRVP